MSDKMLRFVERAQKMPVKRTADERREDFSEIYAAFDVSGAEDQAARCSQCGVPFCQVHCPLGNHIPDWLMLTAEGREQEAYALSESTNNMPEICGRICPQDRLCEGNCVIEKDFNSVTIGSVEKYLTDKAWDEGWVEPIRIGPDRGQTVGIIGTGPAGLAAAEELRKVGYGVTLYDRHDRAGGLLTYGIPGFKLEKYVVERRLKRLEEAGIAFKLGTEVGKDLVLDELRDIHDAVLIATGVYKPRPLEVPGAGAKGTVKALDYLITSNRKGFGDLVPEFDSGLLNAADKRVVVIGGGDTAMDCVRTAVRQGAKSVTCLYRRDRENMPGSAREVAHAEEEGVTFEWLAAPEAILGTDHVTGVQAHRMRLGAPDADGRRRPEKVAGSSFTLDCDMAVMALGFEPEDLPALFGSPELGVTRWGTVLVKKPDMRTNLDGVFAAGDIVRGASLVVWAVKEGRDAAVGIDQYLEEKRAKVASAQEGAAA